MYLLSELEKELNKQHIFEGPLPSIVTIIADSIPANTIPYKMKLAIAMSEIVRYASQFRKHIQHWNSSLIPINSITFCIAKSGASKDSSVNEVRKCFTHSYEQIENERKLSAVEKAIEEAKKNEEENPHTFSAYKKYYTPPVATEIGISTIEGLLQNLADLAELPLGAGYLKSGEFAVEFATNANTLDNLKGLSELTK